MARVEKQTKNVPPRPNPPPAPSPRKHKLAATYGFAPPFVVAFRAMQVPEKFTIALVQMAMASDTAENLSLAISRVEDAARSGARIVCLPELFRSRYFCQ